MKSRITLIICCLALMASAGMAQMDCACSQTVYATSDATCTGHHNCGETTGCVSTTFRTTCSGYYVVSVALDCTGRPCEDFNSCVNIYSSGGSPIYNCHLQDCADCAQDCTPGPCLTANTEYKIWVCLTPCNSTDDCPSPVICTATAKISYCGPVTTLCP